MIGVWTEAKVSFLLYELKTRMRIDDLATCSALTASASLGDVVDQQRFGRPGAVGVGEHPAGHVPAEDDGSKTIWLTSGTPSAPSQPNKSTGVPHFGC